MNPNELPRDKAERILRNAIDMQARQGEMLTSHSVYEIARSLGVDDAYVQRAWEQENAAEEAARAPHGSRRRPESRLTSATIAVGSLFGGIGLFAFSYIAAMTVREAAKEGEVAGGVFMVAVTAVTILLGAMFLHLAWEAAGLALRPAPRQRG